VIHILLLGPKEIYVSPLPEIPKPELGEQTLPNGKEAIRKMPISWRAPLIQVASKGNRFVIHQQGTKRNLLCAAARCRLYRADE